MLDRLQAVFRCLHAHDVKYIVIGGIAAALHGVPRATFDLDVLIEATTENARRRVPRPATEGSRPCYSALHADHLYPRLLSA